MKEFNLPSSTLKELSSILFGINWLKNVGVVIRNQAKGKHLLPLTTLKKRIGILSRNAILLTSLQQQRETMIQLSVVIIQQPPICARI